MENIKLNPIRKLHLLQKLLTMVPIKRINSNQLRKSPSLKKKIHFLYQTFLQVVKFLTQMDLVIKKTKKTKTHKNKKHAKTPNPPAAEQ